MIIGLTGGIGSGKTTVAKLFETLGFAIYNSDDRAKELYFEPEVKKKVIDLLSTEAYISAHEINKPFIANKIFADTGLLQKLNAIIHPAVKHDFEQFAAMQTAHTPIIKETALLFETGIYKEVDVTILVTAPLEVKIERVMNRNSVSKVEVTKRMEAQWTDDKKIPLADFVIINDHKQALIPQVLQVVEKIKKHS